METRFEWDTAKDAANRRKHGVDFNTALRVFADPGLLQEPDRIEGGEQRWIAIGMVDHAILLVVAHTVRDEADGGELIRIISARPAVRRERRRYEEEDH